MRRFSLFAAPVAVLLVGWAIGKNLSVPAAQAQNRTGGDSIPQPVRQWEVVPASNADNKGAARGGYVLYNITTGESYFIDNNNTKWMPLPFLGNRPADGTQLPFSERKSK